MGAGCYILGDEWEQTGVWELCGSRVLLRRSLYPYLKCIAECLLHLPQVRTIHQCSCDADTLWSWALRMHVRGTQELHEWTCYMLEGGVKGHSSTGRSLWWGCHWRWWWLPQGYKQIANLWLPCGTASWLYFHSSPYLTNYHLQQAAVVGSHSTRLLLWCQFPWSLWPMPWTKNQFVTPSG